jgi:altronate dehydratase
MKPAIVITARDNVATALLAIDAGQAVTIDARVLTARQPIPSGHKIALTDIAAGDPVIKYGQPIGLATAAIRTGEHVHTHNLSSTRGRGDLEASAGPREDVR